MIYLDDSSTYQMRWKVLKDEVGAKNLRSLLEKAVTADLSSSPLAKRLRADNVDVDEHRVKFVEQYVEMVKKVRYGWCGLALSENQKYCNTAMLAMLYVGGSVSAVAKSKRVWILHFL